MKELQEIVIHIVYGMGFCIGLHIVDALSVHVKRMRKRMFNNRRKK